MVGGWSAPACFTIHMASPRGVGMVACRTSRLAGSCWLALVVTACHSASPAGVAPKQRTYPDVASALACARDALATAGFLVPPRPPSTNPQDANRIVARIDAGEEQHYAAALAIVRVAPTGDTTVTLEASASTLAGPTHSVRPLSSIALHGRDAVEQACIRL